MKMLLTLLKSSSISLIVDGFCPRSGLDRRMRFFFEKKKDDTRGHV